MQEHQRWVPPELFLNRSKERATLAEWVKRRENILLYGPRRLGKTSLIHRVEEDQNDAQFLYVDCNFVTSEEDLSDRILRALSASGVGKLKRFGEWTKSAMHGLEVEAGYSGEGAYVTLRRGSKKAKPVEDALEFTTRIAKSGKLHVVLVMDEFQDVMKALPDTIGHLRSHAQSQRDVSYFISGSRAGILRGLVSHKNPFWRQLTVMQLEPVDVDVVLDDWQKQTKHKMSAYGRTLLGLVTKGNTQRLMDVLQEAEFRGAGFDQGAMDAALTAAVERNVGSFELALAQLTATQKRLIIALAVAEPKHIMGAKFVRAFDLGSPSGVQRSLAALRSAQFLDEDNRFEDPLCAYWLKINNRGIGASWEGDEKIGAKKPAKKNSS